MPIKRIEGTRMPKVEASPAGDHGVSKRRRAGNDARMGYYRFKYGYNKLLTKMGEFALACAIAPYWPFKPGDNDDNDVRSPAGAPKWRGGNAKNQRRFFRSSRQQAIMILTTSKCDAHCYSRLVLSDAAALSVG